MSKKKNNRDLVVKKERLISVNVDIQFIIKIILVSLLLIAIWYILQYKHLYLYLSKSKKYEYYLFMILVSVLTLMISLCIGLWLGNIGKYFKVVIIIMVFYFIYLGYEYIGLGIDFRTNFGLLNESVFETNTKKGINFFTKNIHLLLIAYIISLPFESEK